MSNALLDVATTTAAGQLHQLLVLAHRGVDAHDGATKTIHIYLLQLRNPIRRPRQRLRDQNAAIRGEDILCCIIDKRL